MDLFERVEGFENTESYRFDLTEAIKLDELDIDALEDYDFLVVYNPKKENDLKNLEITLDHLDINYQKAVDDKRPLNYSQFDAVVLLEPNLQSIKDMERIFKYVENGGRLLYFAGADDIANQPLKKYKEWFGITYVGNDVVTNSVIFNSEILINTLGAIDIKNDAFDYFNPIYLSLTKDCDIHMKSDKGVPIIWEKQSGKGTIVCANYGKYDSKEHRGLITGSISFLMDLFIYPVINSEAIFIDDFPADYRSENKILRENYGRNMERFVLEVWWPDMAKLIDKYGLIYTGVYIETYSDMVQGEFPDNEGITDTMEQIVSELHSNKGEVSFHGYNHQALLLDQEKSSKYGYIAWPDGENIVKGMQRSISFFNKSYPNYKFTTYVPPSNLFQDEALPHLKQALPTLETISGVYFAYTDSSNKENTDYLKQEFAVDSRYGTALPRVTSGAFYTDLTRYNIASVVTVNGIVSHFLHPDDILDPARSNDLNWKDLFKQTDHLFGSIDKQYGWLEKNKASDTAQKIKQYAGTDLYYKSSQDKITIASDHFGSNLSVVVFTDKEIISGTDCEFQRIDSQRYLIKMNKNIVSLEVK